MKICEDCKHYSEPSNSIFVSCKCKKRVSEEEFDKHLMESDVAIDSDGKIPEVTCKYWRDNK